MKKMKLTKVTNEGKGPVKVKMRAIDPQIFFDLQKNIKKCLGPTKFIIRSCSLMESYMSTRGGRGGGLKGYPATPLKV